jgi:hypothetical protein
MERLPKPLVAAAIIFFAFYGAYKAWKAFGPQGFHGFTRGLLALVTGSLLIFLADLIYFNPRYGGVLGYATDGWLAGSAAETLEGNLGAIRSALSIYYGDHGKYPESLDVIVNDPRYNLHPLPRADVWFDLPGAGIRRAHWYRDSAQVKYFASAGDADDSGGWGYVNDSHSPDFGTVFVNCTHDSLRNSMPWNLIGSTPAPTPAQNSAPATAAVSETAREEGFRGFVTCRGEPLAGAELVFKSVDGTRTIPAASNASGRYSAALPAGRYKLAATHPKCKPYPFINAVSIVSPGQMQVWNIILQPL